MQPAVFVIFGITGDLARNKLLPALYHLFKDELLHKDTRVIGLTRQDIDEQELLKHVELCVLETDKVCDEATLKKFHKNLRMLRFDPTEQGSYGELKKQLDKFDKSIGQPANRLFYLAIPPSIYGTVVRHLGESGLGQDRQRSRLLVEKPFGYDLSSAEELIDSTARHFHESQIFRIDHYLAKGTAQNILTFRRDNPLFKAVWNGQHIKRIEVTAAEKIGVQGRASFYDDVGALRDLVQSHLLQLLALTTLELPQKFDEKSLHEAKWRLLSAVVTPPAHEMAGAIVRGQYEGYLKDVDKTESQTETFVSLRLKLDNAAWPGTPLILTTGKKLAAKSTYVRLYFGGTTIDGNVLTFRLQPNEGIDVTLRVRKPGYAEETEPAVLDFDYQAAAHPDAYERVLVDAARGDHGLFASSAEVLASWRILEPILNYWGAGRDKLQIYQPNSAGPRLE